LIERRWVSGGIRPIGNPRFLGHLTHWGKHVIEHLGLWEIKAMPPPTTTGKTQGYHLDDPAMAAYQIEELLNQVLSEKEKILPTMRKKVNWNTFEEDLRFYIDLVYRMERW
jgi:hypothetical protein